MVTASPVGEAFYVALCIWWTVEDACPYNHAICLCEHRLSHGVLHITPHPSFASQNPPSPAGEGFFALAHRLKNKIKPVGATVGRPFVARKAKPHRLVPMGLLINYLCSYQGKPPAANFAPRKCRVCFANIEVSLFALQIHPSCAIRTH